MTYSQNTKSLDFTGQNFFIGIDTHKRNWKVTIRLNHLELKTFSMNPSPIELSQYMNKNYPNGSYSSVYEAGFCGFWINRKLHKHGISNIIVNPADVPTTNKEKSRKRDPIDSRKLSRELENQSLKSLYIPTEAQQAIRSLSRFRIQLSKRRTQVKNHIKSFLHFNGVRVFSI